MASNTKTAVDKATEAFERALSARYQASKTVRREGTAIVLPEGKSIPEAISDLNQILKSEEEEVDTQHTFKCHPYDGIVAFYRSIQKNFGELMPKESIGFFGNRIPGDSISINISRTETIVCPIGNTQIPGVPFTVYINPKRSDNVFEGALQVIFTHKRRYEPLVKDIIAYTIEELKHHSIYKGKAIDSNFEYLDLANFDRNSVIFSRGIEERVEANVLFPIQRTKEWVALGSSLKRGILLWGQYGTGKTLLARMIASICEDNGWTFIHVPSGNKIETALQIARFYEPAVVFFEDIDNETSKTRDAAVNSILNTIDGVLSKDSKVMTIMTTNFMDKIEPGMMRPGRIDSAIHLDVPDAEALERLIRYHGRDRIVPELDMVEIAIAAEGYVPAFIVEGLTKAKTYAALRKRPLIETEDLVAAFNELREQYNAMRAEPEERSSDMEKVLRDVLLKTYGPAFNMLFDRLGISANKLGK